MRGSLPYLQVLAKSKPNIRKLLIDNVPASTCECCLNLLKGVIPFTPSQKRRLARHIPVRWRTRKCPKEKETVSESKGWQSSCRPTSSCFGNSRWLVKMKRIPLIPGELPSRYQQRKRLGTSLIMASVMHKDTQMSNIFQRDDMTDEQKQKLYNANLEQYLELRRQKDNQILSVRVIGKKEDQQQQPQQQLRDAVVEEPYPKHCVQEL